MFKARGSGLDILSVMASVVIRLKAAGVAAIVVFDGNPAASPAKAKTLEQRRQERKEITAAAAAAHDEAAGATTAVERERHAAEEAALLKKAPQVTRSDRDELKQFLHAAAVEFYTVAGEADDFLAYLNRTGRIHAVLTSDTDMLARGVERVIMPETADASVLTEWSLSGVLRGLGLTYDQFVVACTLMGSDYTSAPTVPPTRAIHMANAATALDDDRVEACRLLKGDASAGPESFLSEKQMERWLRGKRAIEPDTLRTVAANRGWPDVWVSALVHS